PPTGSPAGVRKAGASSWRFAPVCDGRGIVPFLGPGPRRVEITTSGLQGWGARLMPRRARQMQEGFAQRHRLPLVDVGPPLLAVERDSAAYLANDPHWNARGHRAVATAILAAIPPSWFSHPA